MKWYGFLLQLFVLLFHQWSNPLKHLASFIKESSECRLTLPVGAMDSEWLLESDELKKRRRWRLRRHRRRRWKRTTIRSRNTTKSLKAEGVWDIGIVEGMGGWSRVATARREEIGWGTCSYQGVPTDRRYIEGLLQAVYKAGRNVTANFTQRREFLTIFAATCWR